MANVRGMEATEQADTVAVSARFVHDDQGEVIGDVLGAVDEVMNLCHGTREQNHHAIESRRRVLEIEMREHAVPVDAAGHAHPAMEEEAVDTAGGSESGGEEDLFGLDVPAFVVGPPNELG